MYILLMNRDMHNKFTFMQMIGKGTDSEILQRVNGGCQYERNLGRCAIVSAEVLNYHEMMDLDDMIIQHPHVSGWVLVYAGNYEFKVEDKPVKLPTEREADAAGR